MELPETFFNRHITFASTKEISEITKPLQSIGISYFTFDKTYDNGQHIRLTNHGEWIEHYYRANLYKKAIFEHDPKQFTNGHVLWSWLNREPIYSEAALYDIDHGITIIERVSDAAEFYHFGSTRSKPISPDDMINNLASLHRFIAAFKEKATHLIEKAVSASVILPECQTNYVKSAVKKWEDKKAFHEFLKKTEVRKLYLGEKYDNNYLTRREIDIVSSLVEGHTATNIASTLSLSQRTLEVHISNIKNKFKCNTLFELGFTLGKLTPACLYPFKLPKQFDNFQTKGLKQED